MSQGMQTKSLITVNMMTNLLNRQKETVFLFLPQYV